MNVSGRSGVLERRGRKEKERYKKEEVVGKVQRFDSRFLCKKKKQRTTERRR